MKVVTLNPNKLTMDDIDRFIHFLPSASKRLAYSELTSC